MTPKLYKAADVCEMTQLQPYVLRSWEKEFPGIGVQKTADGPRLYRQSDVDQVLRIKQLVFGEGLTLAGARRRLDEQPTPAPVEMVAPPMLEADAANDEPAALARPGTARAVAPAPVQLANDARATIATVREGLRLLLDVLSSAPGEVSAIAALDAYELRPPNTPPARARKAAAKSPARAVATRGKAPRVAAKSTHRPKTAAKRKRASA